MAQKIIKYKKPQFKPTNILRYPRLDTVLMVEDFVKKWDGHFKKRQLWEQLPKKMMYQTYSLILEYLLYSRKISIDSEGKIGWIYYPELTENWTSKKELEWESKQTNT